MSAKVLMIQGTGSSVGKSLLVAALCRICKRGGLRVAPFKSQNMSLNSFVTAEGHEMGRAQAVQAEAAGLAPSSLMNPVLLKPTADHTSQVIIRGKVRCTLSAQEYYAFRHTLRADVRDAYRTLAAEHDLILIEGAGSPAEINLRENDLANMGMAAMADAPVVLVGDIDRGGVFAALYGTVKLLEADEQKRIKGFIINKFRGDISILEPGLRHLELLLERPVLGVLPYWNIAIDEEDSLAESLGHTGSQPRPDMLDIAVIRLPRLSNFTDLAALAVPAAEGGSPDVSLRYVTGPDSLGRPDLLILPGTKNTLEDMLFLERSGLAGGIRALNREGVPIIGICGGFQMLGTRILDPLRVENGNTSVPGLGLLPMETRFEAVKKTVQTRVRITHAPGMLAGTGGMELCGYEIHMGHSYAVEGHTPLRPNLASVQGESLPGDSGSSSGNSGPASPSGSTFLDGAVNAEGTVFGSYVHGLFDNLLFSRTLLNTLRARKGLSPLPLPHSSYARFKEAEYDRLADLVEAHLDIPALLRIAGIAQ